MPNINQPSTSQKKTGRKQLRRDRSKLYKEKKKLKEQLNLNNAQAERYEKDI